jgi:hypothetical protein
VPRVEGLKKSRPEPEARTLRQIVLMAFRNREYFGSTGSFDRSTYESAMGKVGCGSRNSGLNNVARCRLITRLLEKCGYLASN